ncbi:hypothetical protein FI667_g11729, partial [Globisporangium splendens]
MNLLTEDDESRATLAAAISFVQSFAASEYDDFNGNHELQYSALSNHGDVIIGEPSEDGGGEEENFELLKSLEELTESDSDLLDQIELTIQSAGIDNGAFSSQLPLSSVAPTQPPLQHQAPSSDNAHIKNKTANKKAIRWDPNKSRNERKQELIYLRKKISELEAQLNDAKKKKKPWTESSRALSPPCPVASHALRFTIPITTTQRSNRAVQSVWKEIAGRLNDERVCAERENVRLKLVLENQMKIAKSLQNLLHKSVRSRVRHQRHRAGEFEKCFRYKRFSNLFPPMTDRTDSQIFEGLLAGFENAYSEIDAVFGGRSEVPHLDTKMHTDQDTFLEVFANKLLPFDVRTTAAAVWNHSASSEERAPYRFYSHTTLNNFHTTEDMVVGNYNVEMRANHTSAHFRVSGILRRYVEKDRVVIAWRAFYEPIEFCGETLAGVQFLEKAYAVVKRPRTISGTFSLIQTCYFANSMLTGELAADDNPVIGAVTDFMLNATAGSITVCHQNVENALLRQAAAQADSIVFSFGMNAVLSDVLRQPHDFAAIVGPSILVSTSETIRVESTQMSLRLVRMIRRARESDALVQHAGLDERISYFPFTREEELRKSITVMSSDVYGAILNTACHHEQEQCTSVSDLTQARNEKRKRDPEATFRCSLRRVLRCQREHQSSPHGDLPPRWRRSTTSTAPALSRRTGTRSRSPPAPIQKHNVADVFADLLACVEHAYDEMDDVLAAHGLLSCGEENVNKSMINASMHFDTDWGKKTIEVVASRVLPFDVNAVGAAAWRQVLSRVPFRDTAKTPSKNRNRIDKETITESFTITILAATSAQFRVRQVFRRYVQPDSQVVIVSCRELVPVTFSGEPWTTGVQFRERGYTVVRPSKTILEEFSLLQSCCISRAELTETLEADNPKVSALLEFVLSAAKANVAASHQAIENKLLDEALKCS